MILSNVPCDSGKEKNSSKEDNNDSIRSLQYNLSSGCDNPNKSKCEIKTLRKCLLKNSGPFSIDLRIVEKNLGNSDEYSIKESSNDFIRAGVSNLKI